MAPEHAAVCRTNSIRHGERPKRLLGASRHSQKRDNHDPHEGEVLDAASKFGQSPYPQDEARFLLLTNVYRLRNFAHL